MRKLNLIKIFTVIVLPVFLLAISCFFLSKNTEAESRGDKVDDVVAYESVLICKGDTLWSLASERLDEPTNAEIQSYIEEIVSINHMSSSQIHTGNYILIPRYDTF
ncbi:MAG: LysM peptidoglycan-binding domain-containing protein [Roseburia sp.]|nr:LysM peptidoglycan-binding domain-containing protein [Roseburia sp.]